MSGINLALAGASYGSAPLNSVAPAVTGTATVGQTLTTTTGTWSGSPAPSYAYQWQRAGSNISGATSSTYVLVAADYANTIRCVVTATNSISPSGVTATSNSTASVAGNVPVNTVAPSVSGTAQTGSTLTTTTGTWTGTPTPTYAYQWQQGTTNISGATSSTYVISNSYAGVTIRCVVTATNGAGSASANSNSTSTVVAAGSQLFTSSGTWVAPAGVTSISVVCIGGGGGASSPTTSLAPAGGGGGGEGATAADDCGCSKLAAHA